MDLTLYRYDVWVLQYQFNRLIMPHRGGMMRGLFEGFQGFRGFSSPCDDVFGPLMMQARKERATAAQAVDGRHVERNGGSTPVAQDHILCD